MLSVLN